MIPAKFTQISDNERGAAMLMTMLMLVILTLIGIAATNTSTFEIMMSGAEKNKKAAFYTAEAGLEYAKKALTDPDIGYDSGTEAWQIDGIGDAWDYDSAVVLKTSSDELLSDKALGDYTYTVKVWDSGRLHIRSEAKGLNNNGKSAVEVIYGSQSEEYLRADGGYTAQAGHNEQKSFSDQMDDKDAMDTYNRQL